jgi:hypothetical protein
MMNDLDDMPSWEELALDQALEIMEDIMELNDEVNGDWENEPTAKRTYMQAKRFIEDFSSGR